MHNRHFTTCLPTASTPTAHHRLSVSPPASSRTHLTGTRSPARGRLPWGCLIISTSLSQMRSTESDSETTPDVPTVRKTRLPRLRYLRGHRMKLRVRVRLRHRRPYDRTTLHTSDTADRRTRQCESFNIMWCTSLASTSRTPVSTLSDAHATTPPSPMSQRESLSCASSV